MRTLAKLAALAAMVSLLVAAPMVSARGGNDSRNGDGKGDHRAGHGKHGKKKRDRGDCGDSRRGYQRDSRYDDHEGRGGDLQVVGLTDDKRLICFESDDPRNARTIGTVNGLAGDTRLVGLDYRPATGDLYGLGNQGGVYTVDDGNAVATKSSQLSVALTGSSFGVDFNPTVDRLRIISDTGQNLRANVDTGATLVDTTLTYPGTPPAPPTTATGVTGAAYTNNDADPNTATTLYDIDSMLDQTVIQSPANAGLLAATGKLGVDTNSTVGFDIYSKVRDGTTVDIDSFASLTVGGQARFYKIRLFTGLAKPVGSFASRNQVAAIAIPLEQR